MKKFNKLAAAAVLMASSLGEHITTATSGGSCSGALR